MAKKPLTGKLLIIKEAIFDNEQFHTAKEWAHILFRTTDKKMINRVYSLMTRLSVHGYTVIAVQRDPEAPSEPGVYMPLTYDIDTARSGTQKVNTKMNTLILKYGLFSIEATGQFPSLTPEISEAFKTTIGALMGQHKFTLEQSRYEQKHLPSGVGSRK